MQSAIKTLSLSIPRVVGGGSPVNPALLNAPGSAGLGGGGGLDIETFLRKLFGQGQSLTPMAGAPNLSQGAPAGGGYPGFMKNEGQAGMGAPPTSQGGPVNSAPYVPPPQEQAMPSRPPNPNFGFPDQVAPLPPAQSQNTNPLAGIISNLVRGPFQRTQ